MNATTHTRSPQLMPLSKEHKDGMAFIDRLRAALNKVSSDRMVSYTRWYWTNHIRPHFFQEERILLPYFPQDNPLAIKLKEDHAYIRDLLLSLDQQADKHSFVSLCDLIDRHINFEEEQVFPYLEKNLNEAQLNDIHEKLIDHPLVEVKWEDRFWE